MGGSRVAFEVSICNACVENQIGRRGTHKIACCCCSLPIDLGTGQTEDLLQERAQDGDPLAIDVFQVSSLIWATGQRCKAKKSRARGSRARGLTSHWSRYGIDVSVLKQSKQQREGVERTSQRKSNQYSFPSHAISRAWTSPRGFERTSARPLFAHGRCLRTH